jgi:hypothetical protein
MPLDPIPTQDLARATLGRDNFGANGCVDQHITFSGNCRLISRCGISGVTAIHAGLHQGNTPT